MHTKNIAHVRRSIAALALSALSMPFSASAADAELLNVSYDVARELYKEINPAFIAEYKKPLARISASSSHTAARASRRARSRTGCRHRW